MASLVVCLGRIEAKIAAARAMRAELMAGIVEHQVEAAETMAQLAFEDAETEHWRHPRSDESRRGKPLLRAGGEFHGGLQGYDTPAASTAPCVRACLLRRQAEGDG